MLSQVHLVDRSHHVGFIPGSHNLVYVIRCLIRASAVRTRRQHAVEHATRCFNAANIGALRGVTWGPAPRSAEHWLFAPAAVAESGKRRHAVRCIAFNDPLKLLDNTLSMKYAALIEALLNTQRGAML